MPREDVCFHNEIDVYGQINSVVMDSLYSAYRENVLSCKKQLIERKCAAEGQR